MSKLALVVNKVDLLKLPHSEYNSDTIIFDDPTNILTSSWALMSRDLCETDESVVQILPYITLIDSRSGEVFIYRRGKAGGEDRLKNKLSVGLGGHVEEQPIPASNTCEFMSQVAGVFAMNMVRELNEEVGLDILYSSLHEVQDDILSARCTLMYSEQDQVAKHHLCLHYIMYVNKSDLTKLEEGCIVDPDWVSFQELNSIDNLEGWSKLCLEVIGHELGYGYN